MEFNTFVGQLTTRKTECLVMAYGPKGLDCSDLQQIDQATEGLIARLIKKGDIKYADGGMQLINEPKGLAAERLLIFSAGKETLNEQTCLDTLSALAGRLTKLPIKSASISLEGVEITGRERPWLAQQLARKLGEAAYLFNPFKAREKKPVSLSKVSLFCPTKQVAGAVKPALLLGGAIANGVNRSRELGDLPGNICTPTYLASQARTLASEYPNLECKVLSEKQMEALGMGSLLSVSAGTEQPAKMIVLEYKGGKTRGKPVVLVGKGITFDSGGISLKPGAGMDEMKYDMCGAASVFGAMKALAKLNLPINVVGILAGCENMPGSNAYRPGDILTTMSGQTVEVLNTDAEGRLVLCDALTYVERFEPDCVIDVATLTGACVIALGHHISAVMSNHNPLAHELINASEQSSDRAWRLPLADEYHEQLKSPFADMANIGGRPGGAITAGCFLSKFTKKYNWAHIDVAGTAWKSGAAKGSTGRPVSMLVQFLLNRSGHDSEE
jgi:leucyl aminopeptidase